MIKKTLIASLLVSVGLSSSGCGIISMIVKNKKEKEKEEQMAAEQGRLDAAIAAKDLGALRNECVDGSKRDWCNGYRDVFTANVGSMQCDKAWSEWKTNSKATGVQTNAGVEAMSAKLTECGSWPIFFEEFVASFGDNAISPVSDKIEEPFLAYLGEKGTSSLEPGPTKTVMRSLANRAVDGELAKGCDEYMALSEPMKDHSDFVFILAELKCPAAVPVFEQGLLSDDMYVRAHSCKGLAKVGEAKHVKPLQNLAWTDKAQGANYNMPVRESCRDAFGKLETRLSL